MSLWSLLGGIGSIYGGIQTADKLYGLGDQIAADTQQMADDARADTAFKGYGVTTGLGSSTVDQYGNTNLGVGPDIAMQGLAGNLAGQSQNAFEQALAAAQAGAINQYAGQAAGMMGQGYDQMANAFANIPGREQEIYNRAMAMQQPGLDAQRASQQAREYAMGRGGVRGSQFGGTAEDAATARAQAQAQNQASFNAMNQAQAEAINAANVGNQMFGAGAGFNQAGLGNAQLGLSAGGQLGQLGQNMAGVGQNYYQQSFLPMQQQMQMMGLGGQNADRFQSGQFTGANLGTQLDLGGLQVLSNMYKTGTELEGNMYASAANALSGITGGLLGGANDQSAWWQRILGIGG